jgi:hypothetical protein
MSALLAKLHVARKQLDLDEADYRAALTRATGKASAAAMSEAERATALAEFERLGFKPRPSRSGRKVRPAHVRKIYALWGELQQLSAVPKGGRGMSHLRAFVRRQTGIDHPDFVSVEAAPSVIEALKARVARAEQEVRDGQRQ